MSYTICIPSYGRHTIINDLTLKCLEEMNIDPTLVKIFVVEEEYALYRSAINTKYEIIIGEKGLIQQRRFIQTYYPTDVHIVCLDDDIKIIDLSLHPDATCLDDFFIKAFQECIEKKSFIWSVYAVFNPFFREKQESISTCLNMCVGAFYGIINRPTLTAIQNKIEHNQKEDIERSLLYFLNDGVVLRYNRVGFKTKYYASVGGLGTLKERLPDIIANTEKLLQMYPAYGTKKIRKNGVWEFVLKKVKAFIPPTIEDFKIEVLPKIDKSEFAELYKMLSGVSIPYKCGTSTRRGFPKHRAGVFGLTRQRLTGKMCNGYLCDKYPKIYNEMERIGKKICPFEYTSIYLNHNVVCPKHKDENNNGKSVLISFGEYSGGNIVIDNAVYDAYLTPIMFNGGLLEHYNTDDLKGNKYSLIFYKIKV